MLCLGLFIKRRVESIEILGVQLICNDTKTFTKTLIMNNFAFTQKLDRIADIGVVCKTQDIVIGAARFLLCCQILMNIGYRVTFNL